jgi:hypothetical protein
MSRYDHKIETSLEGIEHLSKEKKEKKERKTDLLSTALIEDLSDKNLFDYWISSIHDSLSHSKRELEVSTG